MSFQLLWDEWTVSLRTALDDNKCVREGPAANVITIEKIGVQYSINYFWNSLRLQQKLQQAIIRWIKNLNHV